MKDLSFTQEFFLCALKTQGSTSLSGSMESSTCLLAGILLELLMGGYIAEDAAGKVEIRRELPADCMHLSSSFAFIQKNKPMKMEAIAEKYAFDFTKPDELFQSVGSSLVEGGYVAEENGKGLFKNKTRFVPNENEVAKVIEKLRAEFLEPGTISDEVVVLGALLNKSGLIKRYFSKYEIQTLNKRLKEIQQTEAGALVKKLVDYIDTWIVIILSATSGI